MNNRTAFDKIRKPIAPPVKVFKSKKDYQRSYCIDEEEWIEEEIFVDVEKTIDK